MEESEHDGSAKHVKDPKIQEFNSHEVDTWIVLGKEYHSTNNEPSSVQAIETENVTEEDSPNVHNEQPASSRIKQHRITQKNMIPIAHESSDGINENDVIDLEEIPIEKEVHDFDLRSAIKQNASFELPEFEPLTPPFTPDEEKSGTDHLEDKIETLQKISSGGNKIDMTKLVMEQRPKVTKINWIIFSLFATAMAAVILGNSMRLKARVNEINFEHEKRISDLELENVILKNEMNKLRHQYTRSELDEQVQQAENEWTDAIGLNPDYMLGKGKQPIRKVPPEDISVKRKVVWSGDEDEPMLIVDKKYVLPAFCYKRDKAVQDDLFAEYSAKYCDVRKQKIVSKQRKNDQPEQESYNKFIHQKLTDQSREEQFEHGKIASPFNIDYQKAFDAIKTEGSLIAETLGNILNLSPKTEDFISSNSNVTPSPKDPENDEKISTKQYHKNADDRHGTKQRYCNDGKFENSALQNNGIGNLVDNPRLYKANDGLDEASCFRREEYNPKNMNSFVENSHLKSNEKEKRDTYDHVKQNPEQSSKEEKHKRGYSRKSGPDNESKRKYNDKNNILIDENQSIGSKFFNKGESDQYKKKLRFCENKKYQDDNRQYGREIKRQGSDKYLKNYRKDDDAISYLNQYQNGRHYNYQKQYNEGRKQSAEKRFRSKEVEYRQDRGKCRGKTCTDLKRQKQHVQHRADGRQNMNK